MDSSNDTGALVAVKATGDKVPTIETPSPSIVPSSLGCVVNNPTKSSDVSGILPKTAEVALKDKEGINMVIVPPDNKSVVVENERHGRGYSDRYDGTERLKDRMADSLSDVLNQIGNSVVAIEKNGASTSLAVEKTAAATSLAVEKIGAATELSTEKTSAATQLSIEKTAAAGQLATEKTASALALASSLNFSNTQNQISTGFLNTQNQLITGFKDGRYDAAVNTAAIKDSICELKAKMLECCCELKSTVVAEGSSTRELINSVDAHRSARELVDAKNESVLLKLQLSQRSSCGGHGGHGGGND